MADRQLILASGSPRRREILEQMGYRFHVVVTDVDETVDPALSAEQVVEGLARKKARAAVRTLSGAVVVAADTVVVLDGRILGKPRDGSDAVSMLGRLRGRTHQVLTGVAVADTAGGRVRSFVESTDVTMSDYPDSLIDWYVATGAPLDKAGGYGIQERGGLLVRGICGDYYNVVGLPVGRLHDLLIREYGLSPWD